MRRFCVAAALGLASSAAAPAAPIYGVNVHLSQGDSETQIIADTAFLGVADLRDHALTSDTSQAQVNAVYDLASKGYRFDFITGGDLIDTLAQLDSLESTYPGTVRAIEGPNEINNFAVAACPGRLPRTTALLDCVVAYQRALYAAVKADPLLAHVPVLVFTDNPYPAGVAGIDAGNLHPYPTKRDYDAGLPMLEKVLTRAANANPGKPLWVTETGVSRVSGYLAREEASALTAIVTKEALFSVDAIYVYELLDTDNSWGLFDADGTARPAAAAYATIVAAR
jgi:hypothetical protein